MTPRDVRDRYHGHPYEIVIPCLTLEEANAERADLHVAVEARSFIREVSPEPGGDPYCGRPSGGERCGVCGSRQSCYPEPGGVFDRDQARAMLLDYWSDYADREYQDDVLDALAGCVRPAAIDRDALTGVLRKWADHRGWEISDSGIEDMVEDILALVRPVAGVSLTPEDKALVVDVLREIPEMDRLMAEYRPSRQQEIDDRLALAARLEASS